MDYNDIDVEGIVDEVVVAKEQGKLRPSTKRETMATALPLSALLSEKCNQSLKMIVNLSMPK